MDEGATTNWTALGGGCGAGHAGSIGSNATYIGSGGAAASGNVVPPIFGDFIHYEGGDALSGVVIVRYKYR